jgi:hypothetical protein
VVVGRKTIGIGLMSLVGHLKTVCRVPIGQIKKLLNTLFGVRISAGQIAEILHKERARAKHRDDEWRGLRQGLEEELLTLCRPYVRDKSAPQRVLAERIERFIAELLTFVQYPDVPSENNAAERAIRPAVVARKISGGTRSEKGSKTSSVLRTLFETWTIQGRNTIDACKEMLASAASPTTSR